jgi:hypothetical protein
MARQNPEKTPEKLNHVVRDGVVVVDRQTAVPGMPDPLEEHDRQKTARARHSSVKPASKMESWSDDPERESKDSMHLASVNAATVKAMSPMNLPTLDLREIELTLVGVEPLICHAWSKKAKQQILDKQMGIATEGKEKKDPARDYQESLYVIQPAPPGAPFEDGVFGFPAIAFKNAAVTACTSLGKSITKVQARQAFHVVGQLVEIIGRPRMRDDMVRVGMGTADIRFRGEFPEWKVRLRVKYNARVLTAEQITNLFNIAGFAVGVGEWRSERDGNCGQFTVE